MSSRYPEVQSIPRDARNVFRSFRESLRYAFHSALFPQSCGTVNGIVKRIHSYILMPVPKISGKMTNRERGICARVREFREAIKWSQADFAKHLGITRDKLASIEYGRTPLRYDIAWQIRVLFGLSLEWLSVCDVSLPDAPIMDDLPPPEDTGLSVGALLSEVSDKVHGPVPEQSLSGAKSTKRRQLNIDSQELRHRSFLLMALKREFLSWLSRVPDGYTADFCDKIIQLANTYLKALPADRSEITDARFDALIWEAMRSEVTHRLASNQSFHGKLMVDNKSGKGNLPTVSFEIPTWNELVSDLKRLTKAPGAKAQLAKDLSTTRQNVNKWLSGAGAPSAELTLSVLRKWVKLRKAK